MPVKARPVKSRPAAEPFQLLFQSHPTPMWIYNLKTLAFLEVNDAAVEKYGYTREEFLQMTLKDIRPAGEVSRLEKDVKRKRPTLQHSGQWKHRLKDGRVIDVEITSHTLDYNGRKAALVTAQDITARKQAEEALRETEARYRRILENTTVGFFQSTPDGRYLSVNPAMARIYGYDSPEEMLASITDIARQIHVNPARRDEYKQILRENGEIRNFVNQNYRKDGSIIWTSSNARVVKDDKGKILYYEGFMTDITERKKAEKELQESESKYRTLIEQIPAIVYLDLLDGKGTTLFVSPQVETVLGVSVDEWIRQDTSVWLNLVHPEDRQKALLAYQNLTTIGQGYEIEYRMNTRHGSTIWIHDKGIVRQNEDGQLLLQGAMYDITASKQAEETLRQANELLETIFSSTNIMLAYLDRDFNFVRVNRAYAEADQKTPDFFPGRNHFALYPNAKNQAIFQKVVDGGETYFAYAEPFEYSEHPERGTSYWDWSLTPIKDAAGNVSHLILGLVDVTKRVQVEEALRENEALLREAQSVAGLGSYLLDIPSGTWKSSEILNQVFGIGENYDRSVNGWLALIHPDDRETMSEYLAKEVLGQAKEFDKEYRILRFNDHAERWVHGLGKLESDSGGQLVRMHGTIQDITERKRRERELEAEAILAQSLSETLDLNPLLQRVLQAARHAIPNAEKGSLALMVDEEHLRVRAVDGYQHEGVVGYTYPVTWGYAGRAVRERRPVFVPDVQKDAELRQDAESAMMEEVLGLKSAIAVPLVVHETIIGVLSLESTRPNAFLEEDLRLLVNFAVSTALIIERARLFEETRRQAKETSALLQTSLALTDLNLETILQTIGERASALFESDACRIFLTDETDPDTLRCVLALGENQEALIGLRVQFGVGVTGSVAARGQAEIVNDMQSDPRAVQVSGTPDEEEAIMFAPLKLGTQVIGVMSVKRLGLDRPFFESDLELLKAFASMSASAVSNARLFEAAHQRVKELEMLHESGMALNQLLTPKEIGQRIIELLRNKMNWHHTTIRLYHPQSETFELLAFNQPGLKSEAEWREAEEHFNRRVFKIGDGLSGWAVQHAQIVRSGDVSNDPRYADTYPGLKSGLYVPIKAGERVLGVISIESEAPNAFSEADERLVNTLANQAASAFENSRLFEETRQRVTELATVNRISIALRAITKKEEMLAIVLEETLAALNTTHGSINLWNPETGKIHRSIARGWLSEFTEQPIQPGEGIFGKVFSGKNMHVSRDFNNDPLTFPASREQIPVGWGGACVPISSATQTLGVMLVSVPSSRELSKDEIRLLNTLAEMTGNALHRMELHEETIRRAEEFASLYETNKVISAEHELNALLHTIVKSATDLLHATGGGVYLYDQVNDDMEMVVATHPSIKVGTRLQIGEGIAGRVAQTHQSFRVDDYATWDERSPKYENASIRAVLEVPILFGGELIGVLVAHEVGDSERKFTDTDERLLSLFAAQAAGAIRSARLREETEQRLQNLQALRQVDRVITSSFDLRPILNAVVSHTVSQLGVDAADILLLNPPLQTLEYAAGFGFRTRAIERSSARLGQGHAGTAAFSHQTVHVPNLPESGPDFRRASLLANENFIEYFGVPLITKGEVKGILEIFNRSPLRPKREWLELLETMAGQAAIAIDNSQLFEKIQHSNLELALAYDATIEGWSRAMELRDEDTEGHTQRVTEKTVLLARSLGLHDEEILHIRRGALLHDIGKIGVPDNILLKKGPLTEQEWEIMRKHPLFAYQMLQPIHYLRPSIDIPYLHHEKWDGTGYPLGLKGEQIPLAARIFAIADVYDALISDRPYRKAWSEADALNYIREQSGKHFDPEVVDKFLQLFGSGQY